MNVRFLLAAALLAIAGLAQADMVLIANPGVDVGSLSKSDVSRLFLGQTDLLPNGSKAVPLNVSGESQDQFSREILGKSPEQISKYWARMVFTGKAKQPREVGAGDVKAQVANTPGALSYIDRSQVDKSVKVIAVTGN